MEPQELELYWRVQTATIGALRQIGIEFRLRDRIPPMVIMRKIRQFWMSPGAGESILAPAYAQAEVLLCKMVELRTRGMEPPHDRVKYLA